MGQYFLLVNVDREEFVALPGGMKLIERVTNPVAMGMLGYLLFQGSADGTVLSGRYADPSDERIAQGIEEQKEREREYEREHDRDSTYRADDGTWREDRMARVVAAGFDLSELTDYCGRWAGDDVRLVGDYAENDLYTAHHGTVVAETTNGKRVTWESSRPHVRIPCRPGVCGCDYPGHAECHHPNEEAEPGDWVELRGDDVDDDYGHFVEYRPNEWTDITDDLQAEFIELVGEEWIKRACESTLLRPDAVLTA